MLKIIKRNWFGVIIVILIIVAIIVLRLSKVCNEGWLRDVLISFACGLFSGLTLYFLTNIRNVKNFEINDYYSRLKKIVSIMIDIRRDAEYYKDNENLWGEETGICLRCQKLIDRLDVFQDEIYELPDNLFIKFTGGFENILTNNCVDAVKEKYNEIKDYDDLSEYEETYKAILDYMNKAKTIINPVYESYRTLYKKEINSIL